MWIVLLINFVATSTVYIGAKLSLLTSISSLPFEADRSQEVESVDLTLGQVMVLPFSSSVVLLLLFFYFQYIQYILLALLVFVSASALNALLFLLLHNVYKERSNKLACHCVSIVVTVGLVMYWIATGDLIIHNILGCALCITFISTLKFPSLKIAVVCLLLLTVYDIFWVFFSEYFFRENVMIDVAQKVAANPVHTVGKYLNNDYVTSLVKSKIELPLKLIFKNFSTGKMMILGLGDIALPGALVALALRCDESITREQSGGGHDDSSVATKTCDLESTESSDKYSYGEKLSLSINESYYSKKVVDARDSSSSSTYSTPVVPSRLFDCSVLGYTLGLFVAFAASIVSGHGQPALIYLVPGVLLPIVGRAWFIGKLRHVWHGPEKIQESS